MTHNCNAGKERYGGTEFGKDDLIEKRQIDIICTRCASTIVTAFQGNAHAHEQQGQHRHMFCPVHSNSALHFSPQWQSLHARACAASCSGSRALWLQCTEACKGVHRLCHGAGGRSTLCAAASQFHRILGKSATARSLLRLWQTSCECATSTLLALESLLAIQRHDAAHAGSFR